MTWRSSISEGQRNYLEFHWVPLIKSKQTNPNLTSNCTVSNFTINIQCFCKRNRNEKKFFFGWNSRLRLNIQTFGAHLLILLIYYHINPIITRNCSDKRKQQIKKKMTVIINNGPFKKRCELSWNSNWQTRRLNLNIENNRKQVKHSKNIFTDRANRRSLL